MSDLKDKMASDHKSTKTQIEKFIDVLQCPKTHKRVEVSNNQLLVSTPAEIIQYDITPTGIPLFAKEFATHDARVQEAHFDKVAQKYVENLNYPHTQEYMRYLDHVFLKVVDTHRVETIAEICCGRGEAVQLLGNYCGHKIKRAIGIDISTEMLEKARMDHAEEKHLFLQGDAVTIPLCDNSVDSVFMLGGIHHVPDRLGLFSEIHRILKPGGHFYFREPVSDFFVWRWIRHVIYYVSPMLDFETERPLRYKDTVPLLKAVGLKSKVWKTYGFLGFCFFMNSDVLFFNRFFRFIPGIRFITRLFVALDDWTVKLPFLRFSGLAVVGVAEKE